MVAGGYGLGVSVFQISHTSGQWHSQIVLHTNTAAPHIHSPTPWRDHVLVTSFKEHGAEKTGLVCLDPNGRALWQTGPGKQFDSGAYLVAGDLLYILNGKTGELSLYELSETAPRLLASARVLNAEDGNVWAPMALSEGLLLIRDQHQLKCLDVRPSR
jgi:hypothetical protein